MTGQYMGEFIATDLWEMFNAFAEIGFGEAGEPENLNNTKEVQISTPDLRTDLTLVARCSSQYLGRVFEELWLERSSVMQEMLGITILVFLGSRIRASQGQWHVVRNLKQNL